MMAESHNIWVQYTESDLDKTFQALVSSFPVLYFSWTILNEILQLQKYLSTRKMESTVSKMWKKTQQRILHPQAQDYAVVIPTM